ncbi:MAG: cynT 4 [Planctomycetota bacterium]|nr:cynT 4 [Planctomycetota bacterium]
MSTTDETTDRRAPIDFTYRFQPDDPKPFFIPRDWEDASVYLQGGNHLIVRFYEACRRGAYKPGSRPPIVEISASEATGLPVGDDGLPVQMPFAVVLGCSDARVPTELLFGQEFNDIFNIRVAGNVLAEEGVGSLLYALRSFVPESAHPGGRSLKLAAVLGHRGCGAVKATVKAFQSGPTAASIFGDPIGSIVTKIAAPALALASELLDESYGAGSSSDPRFLSCLVEMIVYLNAAWGAREVREWVDGEGPEIASRVGVVYGVFDPEDWRVRSRPATSEDPAPETFAAPPKDLEGLRAFGREVLARLRPPGS